MKDVFALYESNFPDLKLLSKGKVREIYDLGDSLLFVASDRISAFDVIMGEAVPGKGVFLNNISKYWFENSHKIIKNHFITDDFSKYPHELQKYHRELIGRSMIVKKCKPLPVEFVVRGYIAGSGWKEYQANSTICGVKLPEGKLKYSKIDNPIFTPATKAETGHDENIDFDRAADILGKERAEYLKKISIQLYEFGRDTLAKKGIILADTKFEFGEDENGDIILIDEVMTPDSSRFWNYDTYKEGQEPDNFDKQTLRDWLETQDWDKEPPAPKVPDEIINKIISQYKLISEKIFN
jgi:phosphoribosylaminoimidazole-succinocarboxamide synthase